MPPPPPLEEIEEDQQSDDDSTSESGLDEDEYDPEVEDFGGMVEGTEDMMPPGEDDYNPDEGDDGEGMLY